MFIESEGRSCVEKEGVDIELGWVFGGVWGSVDVR